MEKPNERIIESEVGDIHVPSSKIPFDIDVSFIENNPVQFDGNERYGASSVEKGLQRKPGFAETFGAEFYEFNATAQLGNAGIDKYESSNIYEDNSPIDFKPNNYPEMFYDIKPQYQSYLLDAKGMKDLQFRRNRVLSEQKHDETLQNGSMFARILGGLSGAILDPINLIPIASSVKYAKLGKTFLRSAAKAAPGVAAAGIIQSGAKQLDRVNGNLHDFVVDSFINTVAGTALFGGLGIGGVALEHMEIWNLRKLLNPKLDFKMKTNEKGEITGIDAFDTTGNMSADEVSFAQEMANSSFLKSGFFKIPYAGTALLKLKGAPVIGSPLVAMINSHYVTERAFADRAADHGFYVEGIEKGEASVKSFESRMQQEHAELRSISRELNGLHLQMNGFNIKARPIQDIVQIGLDLKQKSLDLLGKDTEKYVTREDFDRQVQEVLFSGEQSQHPPVNEAAAIVRKKIDSIWEGTNKAYGKSVYAGSPKMAKEFLMRVYNTEYLNSNQAKWLEVITKYLRDSDILIEQRMQPITSLERQIEQAIEDQKTLINSPSITTPQVKAASDKIEKLKSDLKIAHDDLQNELRDNDTFQYLVDNPFALSANEAKELEQLLKPSKDLEKQISDQQAVVSDLKQQRSRSQQAVTKGKTVETARKHDVDVKAFDKMIEDEENKLVELKNKLSDEEFNLYEKAKTGQINPVLFYPETYKLKNPNERLKFRKTYENELFREAHANAYWNSIMHMNPEDIIGDLMGRMTGSAENTLKERSLLIPDHILYDNNFMTNNLMSKVNNYVLFLSRRMHLKNVYKDVSHDGGIEPMIEKLRLEHMRNREQWDKRKGVIEQELANLDKQKDAEKIKKLSDEVAELESNIKTESKKFNQSKERFQLTYERMMGLRRRDKKEVITQGVMRTLTAVANLHLLPLTMISDLGAIGLQHGVWNFVKDGVRPFVESLNGYLKTQGSEAYREGLGHLHLGLQDVINGHADKNIAMETMPYVNMGKWVDAVNKIGHLSGNMDLTNYLDNWLQRLTASVVQSKLMKNLILFTEGKLSKKETEYLLKYGIDPKEWAERMVKAYKGAKGFESSMGGHESMFWKWQDMEASNLFSDAIFKAVKNTIIQRGLLDSPFWADNMLGMIFHTFTGWAYASVNRYLIPLLQRPDAEKMLGVIFSLSMGAMVSPLRRLYRGEEAWPEDMTAGQVFYEAAADSAVSSALTNVLSYANFLSGDTLLGNLKNDKYRNRVGVGALSPVFGTIDKTYNFTDALAHLEMNEKDAKNMAHMLPGFGSLYGRKMSDAIIEYLGLPANRSAARAENG